MSSPTAVKVWDLPVRIFHWSLVVCFVIAYVTGEESETLHAWFGYIIAALVLFRIVYGFVGSRYARFSDFVRSPVTVFEYLKKLASGSPNHYLGHNPAGGWMVLVLLLSLALTTWSGLEAYATEGHGPLADTTNMSIISSAYADSDDENDQHNANTSAQLSGAGEKDEFWEEIHEFFVNFTLLMVIVHVAGVVVSGRLHGENLVKAMITGKKIRK